MNKISFICVGVHKCATTTLDAVLRGNNQLYLPDYLKETQFCSWCKKYPDALNKFYDRYFTKDDDRIRGLVEPEFFNMSDLVKEYFGNNIKILILLRNPVEMLFSFFKMKVERGEYLEYYDKKYRKDTRKYDIAKMFDEFAVDNVLKKRNSYYMNDINVGNYFRWIEKYKKNYDIKQIRIYLFENFITSMQKEVDDICNFLEVSNFDIEKISKENIGQKIARNQKFAKLNNYFYVREYMYRSCEIENIKSMKNFEKFFEVIKSKTNYEYRKEDAYITERARRICEDFYRDEKNQLADYLQYDLDKIWFK